MEKMCSDLRQAFLSFFAARDHQVVASGSLVPQNDPSLMFANAGMVPFKNVFTGHEKRDYARATSSQKCIRISGKHNDLEAVGPSPRHHTFFEMLGNFSFGDYFKEEAIVFAWEFLTRELGLPQERLIVTYFEGAEGIAADETARDLWKKVSGFSDERIRPLDMSENFWQMGDTGPCGPCSEIYYYHGPEVDLGSFGQEQSPEGVGWMEIWNLVFMQFERKLTESGAVLDPLPAPSIDTGAGLERLATCLQGKISNYDTDLLRRLVDHAAELAGKKYSGSMSSEDVSMRVIADHARTTAFLIAEGVMPERTGREYVLRRVMRRAIRHGHRLGIAEPFLHKVAASVIDMMGAQYPELVERKELITSVAEDEEVRFRQTIERGLGLLEERFKDLEARGDDTVSGQDAFKLYDTYGFPLDLTEVICKERGLAVDVEGYEVALDEARKRSEFKGVDQAVEAVYREALERLGRPVQFVGYEKDEEASTVVALVKEGQLVESAQQGDPVEVVCAKTPFYAESGGQVGDRGVIEAAGGQVDIEDTIRPLPGCVVHRGTLTRGALAVGDEIKLRIDVSRRERTRRNHSATHLLHWALRKVIGSHAQQKGSLVGPDRFRFDFTQTRALKPEEIQEIEDLVNSQILLNSPVQTQVMGMDEAREQGAMMIFEEKYGDVVRMLSMGPSRELCGGTHARATGDLGLFKVLSEQGVAAGVRRIIATTGEGSLEYLRELEGQIGRAAQAAKTTPASLPDRLEKLLARERALEKEVELLQRQALLGGNGSGGIDELLARAKEISDIKVLGVRTAVSDRGALRELAEQLRDKLGDSVVLVGSESDGKAQLVLTVARSLTQRLRAADLIRPIAEMVGGSGGGRPDMAQAGGSEPAKLDEAIEAVYRVVEQA